MRAKYGFAQVALNANEIRKKNIADWIHTDDAKSMITNNGETVRFFFNMMMVVFL